MNRISLGGGKWFDEDVAEKFSEGKRSDGRNMITMATQSQWEHETVYRTRGGSWILNFWSQVQGGRGEVYKILEPEEAYRWLIAQEHFEAAEKHFSTLFSQGEVS